MKTRFLPLTALVLLALGTACDLDDAASVSNDFRDGEVIATPTKPIGTGIVIGGGVDDPTALLAEIPIEILELGFNVAPLEYQELFHEVALAQARAAIEADFVADERNMESCPWVCEELRATWNERAYVAELMVEYGEVTNELDAAGNLFWQADAYASAEVGCGCEI